MYKRVIARRHEQQKIVRILTRDKRKERYHFRSRERAMGGFLVGLRFFSFLFF